MDSPRFTHTKMGSYALDYEMEEQREWKWKEEHLSFLIAQRCYS
jgi:hypothetical protein